jgi:hypothetical protein
VKNFIFVLLLLSMLTFGQTAYLPVGTSRAIQPTNLIIGQPSTIQGAADQSKYDTAFQACMPPANPDGSSPPSAGNATCTQQADMAVAIDIRNRADAAILALYDAVNSASSGAADAILATNNLYPVKK